MTGRIRADHGSPGGGLHLQMSRLLLVCLVAAVAATGALIVTAAVVRPELPPPPPPGVPPGPPPRLESLAVITIVTGLFVLAWLAALTVYCRDEVLARLAEAPAESTPDGAEARRQIDETVERLRAELAADRHRELAELGDRIAAMTNEYGEQRETDGYLTGMRAAAGDDPPVEPNVRTIRRLSPPG